MNRRERLCIRLARLLGKLLGDRGSWSGGTDSGRSWDGKPVVWFQSAQRAGRLLTLVEAVTTENQVFRVVRSWALAPHSDGKWLLEMAEKNHEALDEEWINDELEDTIGRLEDPQTAKSKLEIPKARLSKPIVSSPISGIWTRRFRWLTGLAFSLCFILILISISSLQYQRMLKLVGNLDSAIGLSSIRQAQAVQDLSKNMTALDDDLELLRGDAQRKREEFDFNRKNAAMTLRRLGAELPSGSSSRKRAYEYLADRIESSGSYGDIIYQLSRIPENNFQAETVMTVDRASIIPLSAYRSTVTGLGYPARLDGEDPTGEQFMISSGFGELRLIDSGAGGYLPHMAIDIINVGNILTVTEQNSIIRFPGEPGSVISAYDGVILYSSYSEVYGWNLEVSHSIEAEWRDQYRGIRYLTTYYAHLAENSDWKGGETVRRGEKLGAIGETGNATGPHLHFEVRVYRDNGESIGWYGNFDRVNPYVLAN